MYDIAAGSGGTVENGGAALKKIKLKESFLLFVV
jgi:hypothetical protein